MNEETLQKRLRRAKKLLRDGSLDDALSEVEKVLAADGGNASANKLKHKIQSQLGKLDADPTDLDSSLNTAFEDMFAGADTLTSDDFADLGSGADTGLDTGKPSVASEAYLLGIDDDPDFDMDSLGDEAFVDDENNSFGGESLLLEDTNDAEWEDFKEVTGEFKRDDFVDASEIDEVSPKTGYETAIDDLNVSELDDVLDDSLAASSSGPGDEIEDLFADDDEGVDGESIGIDQGADDQLSTGGSIADNFVEDFSTGSVQSQDASFTIGDDEDEDDFSVADTFAEEPEFDTDDFAENLNMDDGDDLAAGVDSAIGEAFSEFGDDEFSANSDETDSNSDVGADTGNDSFADFADFGDGSLDDSLQEAMMSDDSMSGGSKSRGEDPLADTFEDDTGFDPDELDATLMRSSTDGDGFSFDQADIVNEQGPSDESLGFDASIQSEEPDQGDSFSGGGDFDFSDFQDENDETMGFDESEPSTFGEEDTFDEELPADFSDPIDSEPVSTPSAQFYEDFGFDEGGDSLGMDGDSLSGDIQIEEVKQLWAQGTEQYRQRNYEACIATMEQLLALDPSNESAQSYIDLARDRIESGAASPSEQGMAVDFMTDSVPDAFAGSGDAFGDAGAAFASDEDDEFMFNDSISPMDDKAANLGEVFADDSDDDGLEETLIRPTGMGDAVGGAGDGTIAMEDSLSRSFVQEPTFDPTMTDVSESQELASVVKEGRGRQVLFYLGVVVVLVLVAGGGWYGWQEFGGTIAGGSDPEPAEQQQPVSADQLQGGLAMLFDEAVDLQNAGNYAAALSKYREIDGAQPGNREVQQRIEQMEYRLDQMDDSGNDLQQRLARVASLYTAGEEAFEEQRYEETLTTMTEVLELQPSHQGAQYYIRQAQEELARQREMQEQQRNIDDLVARAQSAMDDGDFQRSIDLLDRALGINPDLQSPQALRDQAMNRLAAQRLTRLNELIAEGKEHYDFERYESCIRTMREALAINSGNVVAQNFIELSEGKLDIIRTLEQAREHFENGEYDTAIALTDDVITREPNNEEAKQLKETARLAKADLLKRFGGDQ